jgi:hypothetical protein
MDDLVFDHEPARLLFWSNLRANKRASERKLNVEESQDELSVGELLEGVPTPSQKRWLHFDSDRR